MPKILLFHLSGNMHITEGLTKNLNLTLGSFEERNFPDGETYLRFLSEIKNNIVLLVCTLDHPNTKILPLLFAIKTLRDLGAQHIGLITTYLPYLRQDKRFHSGEALTSSIFAQLLSVGLNSLLTFDPHLHRITRLADIYTVPTIATLHANKAIITWIKTQIADPLLIGPDEESEQWVKEIATGVEAPYIIAKKIRYGDRQISLSLPKVPASDKTPILMDDIISTGTSMLALIKTVRESGFKKPIVITVHALFNENTQQALLAGGAANIVSCNTIAHFSNAIDVTPILVEKLKSLYIDCNDMPKGG